MHKLQTLQNERITSIREIQKNPSKVLQGITRVLKGTKTMGFYLSNEEYNEFIEDLEAVASKDLKARVKKARRSSIYKKSISLDNLVKEYGI